eukprot:gene7575-3944_t
MRITGLQTGDPQSPLPELRENRKWIDVTDPALGVQTVQVRKHNGGIGATFRGVRIATVDPHQTNGIYLAMQYGYPLVWSGVTGE